MAPKASQSSQSKSLLRKSAKSAAKVNTLKLDAVPSSAKRTNPLTAFVNLPLSQPTSSSKGKEKEKAPVIRDSARDSQAQDEDSQLWVDLYEPTTEAELAVHVKKVEDVRRWLVEAFEGGPSGKLRKYRRILALTGPAGTAKTTTVRILAREMDFEILEWRNAIGENSTYTSDATSNQSLQEIDPDHEALFSKFETFLARASTCNNLFRDAAPLASSSQAVPSSSAKLTQPSTSDNKRRIILLEDLPNLLHNDTKARFHEAFQSLVIDPSPNPVPIVIIVSDTGTRGEASDERLSAGSTYREQDGVIDIRTVLPKDMLSGPYVTQIRFNPIAPTFLRKALQALIDRHFPAAKGGKSARPSKHILDIIVDSANGDIRSAVNALQFSSIAEKGRKKGKSREATLVMEAVTRREQSLALFHLIGKVLYNKRKGDPPAPSASKKDIEREKALDELLEDPPDLPSFLSEHRRRTSRVNVDTLCSDSPIDSSLYSLYLHQNYTQFCNDIDECDGIADNLSWVDSSGGEAWYQANPHRFHLLTLGTLHSLPTPVERRSQKVFKPEFFDYLNKEKDAWEGVRDVRRWLVEKVAAVEDAGWRNGGWSRTDVPIELGGVLRARDASHYVTVIKAPPGHRSFSRMMFVRAMGDAAEQLGEAEADGREVNDEVFLNGEDEKASRKGGWLESDDIEEF
ncbi:Rad17 cell cycle checkpoint protein-domain-containing protein [Armillaria nabsnona]|nr:Rad17 cell cycle checkpoint protein-domain-containing protein [Armillaria nabsnona]